MHPIGTRLPEDAHKIISGNLKTTAVTVGTTATALPSIRLTGRMTVLIQNQSANPIFIGASDVTTSSGIRLAQWEALPLDASDATPIFAIAGSAGNSVVVLEG